MRQPTLRWDGESMVPENPKEADEAFVVGQTYTAKEAGQRSGRSHRHYFALVHEAWTNLPEHLERWFPNEEALRKFGLIKAGYCDTKTVTLGAPGKALKFSLDDYSIVEMGDDVMTVHTAHSQSEKAMGKERFQRSKDDVLGVLSKLIGVDVTELRKAA